MATTYGSKVSTKLIDTSEYDNLKLNSSKLELISFISNQDAQTVFSDSSVLLESFLRLLQDDFCTNQDYKEFLEFYTKKFISINL